MNLSAVANRAPLLLTVFLATGAMLFKAIAAEVPAPRLAWQVSPDELRLLPPWRDDQGVRLAWHDLTTRACGWRGTTPRASAPWWNPALT